MEKTAQSVSAQTAWIRVIRANGAEELRLVGFYSRNPLRMWLYNHGHHRLALLGWRKGMGPAERED